MNMINIMEKTHPNFISQIITMINHNGALTRCKGWMDDDDDDDKVDIYIIIYHQFILLFQLSKLLFLY